MLARVMIICLTLMACLTPAEAGVWDGIKGFFSGEKEAAPEIKVLIVDDDPRVTLQVTARYSLEDASTDKHISTRPIGKAQIVQTKNLGIKWGEEFPGIYQIRVVPKNPRTEILVNGVSYPGDVAFYDVDGQLSVINRITIEEYLRCLLPGRHPENMPDEALAAAVITARTETYFQATQDKNPFWDVNAIDVGYHGVGREPSEQLSRVIDITHDMVLTRTSLKTGKTLSFPAEWSNAASGANHAISSRITLEDAVEMANQGKVASEILEKAFPGATVQLIQG